MQVKNKKPEVQGDSSSLPVVEVLVVITILTALLLGVIISTNPLGKALSQKNRDTNKEVSIPLPSLSDAKNVVEGGMPFSAVMGEFPQIVGGYIAPYNNAQKGHPFYLEVSVRDRVAPVARVIARIGQQEIPLTLVDGTEQDGTWSGVWTHTGESDIRIISYDTKNNKTEMEVW